MRDYRARQKDQRIADAWELAALRRRVRPAVGRDGFDDGRWINGGGVGSGGKR